MFFCRQLHVLFLSMVAAAAAVLSICVDAVKMRLLWLSIIIGFNGAETNCRIAHILGILLMNSCNTDRFLATTVVCGLSTLICFVLFMQL